ncbi:RNI-like protein, partial [Gonapodya prolifera JEL478]
IDFVDKYTQACAEAGRKPLQGLIRLMTDAIDSGSDLDTLSFTGTRKGFIAPLPSLAFACPDDADVAVLLPALKVLSVLARLDLSFCRVGDLGARAIANHLKDDRRITSLNLANNDIGGGGAQAIAKALEVNDGLGVLSLAGNRIGDEAGLAIATMLQVNITLHTLDLSSAHLSSQSLIPLSTVLRSNTTITSFDVSNNVEDGPHRKSLHADSIAHVGRTIRSNGTLKTLGLARMAVDDWMVTDHLAAAVGRNAALVVLDLSK